MRIPLLLFVVPVAEAAPLLAAAISRQPVRGARAWVLAWCAVLLVTTIISLSLALLHRPNAWLSYVYAPIGGAIILWALSCWQRTELARLTMRYSIVGVVVAWALLTAMIETTSTVSRAAEPVVNLVCLGAAMYTLVARGPQARGLLLRQDWAWMTAGLALYLGTWSALLPLRVCD